MVWMRTQSVYNLIAKVDNQESESEVETNLENAGDSEDELMS